MDGTNMRSGAAAAVPQSGGETLNRQTSLLVILCVSAPSFMVALDANVAAVSLPSIGRSLHAGFDGIEWVITAYTLAFASLLLPAGALADRYGRTPALMLGLAIFTVASFACGAAPNLGALVVARAFQGLGAATQLSAGLATLSHSFRGAERARAFSFWGSAVGAGMCLGPIVGGLITQLFGWQWAFYINLPVGAAAIALTAAVISNSKDPHAVRLDLPGVLTFGVSLFLITHALISGNQAGWGSPSIRMEALAAAFLMCVFVWVERRQQRPMLDLSFFRIPTFLGGVIAQFTFAAAVITMFTYIPIYFQGAFGYAAGQAGLMMTPLALPLFVVPRVVTLWLAHRLTGRALLTIGLGLASFGLSWMAVEAVSGDAWAIMPGMLFGGVGAGLLNSEATKVTMTVIPPERAGMASGLSGTTRFTGVVVGFAILGVVLYRRIGSAVDTALPHLTGAARASLTHSIASGRLDQAGTLSVRAFAVGYQSLLLAGAISAALAAVLVWRLVRAEDTPPV